MTDITLQAKEILELQIEKTRKDYPMSLKPKHLIEIMNASKSQIYEMLAKNEIPSAKKISGLGWRIPRDVFLSWYYGRSI